jgi:transglutaminase-like putative cysteine protease
MYYSIVQTNRFRYSAPIRESVMEVRMQPLDSATQQCLSFGLSVRPEARVQRYRDCLGNIVHHFDVPGRHSSLHITAEAMIEVTPPASVPDAIETSAWNDLVFCAELNEAYEMLLPSHFAQPTEKLRAFADEIGLCRRDDPLTMLRYIGAEIYSRFNYVRKSTRADSPIDDALMARQGVCQDFTHIFVALSRFIGIPCRYVSGYLHHASGERSTGGATHAWAEALLPGLGWIGFDPTNNSITGGRHIRVAIGRDYADVPPTRGVYKKTPGVTSELDVSVRVTPASELPPEMEGQIMQPQSLTASGNPALQPAQQQQ